MLYLLASIAFFLFSIRLILQWTYVWQKNGYHGSLVIDYLRHIPLKKLLWHILPLVVLLFLLVAYAGVIFYDGFTLFYQLFVTIFFVISAGIFVKELRKFSFTRPHISLKSLILSLTATFLVSLLYMIPLVDGFLWLVVLASIIPILVLLVVLLLIFPTELYEDFLIQGLKQKLKMYNDMHYIAITGNYTEIVTSYVSRSFTNSDALIVGEGQGLISTIRLLKKELTERTNVYIFILPLHKNELKKLREIFKVSLCVVTSDVQNKNQYKTIMQSLPSHTTLLSHKENTRFNTLARHQHRKVMQYGLQKSAHKYGIDIFGYGEKINRKRITLTVNVEKNIILLKDMQIAFNVISHMLPVLYIVRKFGRNERERK